MPTIYDISQRLKISPSTVSRALRPNTQVSEALREKVRQEAERIGYRPNLIAKQLKENKSNLLGLILDETWNWFSSSVTDGVQEEARRLGYNILVWNAVDAEDEKNALGMFYDMRAAGVIIASTEMLDAPKPNPTQALPSVYICRDIDACDTIKPDDYSAAEQMAAHLLDLGHRRIALILGPENSFHTRTREQAVRDVMRRYGVPLREDWVVQRDWHIQDGYAVGMALLGRAERPTAILSLNDAMAFGVNDAARELGLSVPGDVSIIGHDNHDVSGWMRPELTTFSLPLHRMGKTAVAMLVERIQDPHQSVRHEVVRGEMVVRQSCGQAPTS